MKDDPTTDARSDVRDDARDESATFAGMLQAQSVNRRLRKSERTRYLILGKIAERIEQSPTGRITVETLLNDTGLSRGTFYNYFRDINDGIYVLLALFLETWNVDSQRQGGNKDLFKAIFDTNLLYCLRYEKNAAFFSAFSYYASSMSELLVLRNQINAAWAVRIAKAIERRFKISFSAQENTYLQGTLRMLIVMTTGTLEEYYVHRNPLLCAAFSDVYELSFALSRQWHPVLSNPAYSVAEMAHYQTLKGAMSVKADMSLLVGAEK
ncbi:MAG: TetR/AcrR family transcriptional regulator [Candidimonas sp.]|jgi:AcrR family transcriptional regulator